MKELLPIGEFAKLTNTTIETLRHYDKKGIFKPNFVDMETGYRYYNILQCYKLYLILELREIGMSIDDIKIYIDNQTINTSLEVFDTQLKNVKDKISNLEKTARNISAKIDILNRYKDIISSKEIIFKNIDERKIITLDNELSNEYEFAYSFLEFDKQFYKQVENILATLIPYGFFLTYKKEVDKPKLFFIIDDIPIKYTNITIIEKNTFACIYYKGGLNKTYNLVNDTIKKLIAKGYKVCGKIILLEIINLTLTQVEKEYLYEIQIPIKKC